MFHYLKALIAASRVVRLNAPIWGEIPVLDLDTAGSLIRLKLPLNADTAPEGKVSVFWESREGHLIAEPLPCLDPNYREYEVLRCFRNLPKQGQRVWVSGWLGERPEDFGLTNYDSVQLDNGTKAILSRSQSNRWIILVHGRKASYSETLRLVPTLNNLGLNVLAISHETDPKPLGLGKVHSFLGSKEWTQVEHAVEYAKQNGASEINLLGFSLGSLFISEYLQRSPEHKQITKIIFDSPLIDIESTLRLQASLAGYSHEFGSYVYRILKTSKLLGMLGLRRKNMPNLLHEQPVPMLVLYSQLDGYVSMGLIDKMIELNPRSLFINFPGGRHCRLFNQSENTYVKALKDFLG